MGSATGFWLSFGATLGLLAVAVGSGLRGRRRLHLLAGPLALVSLVVAIIFTEQLMRSYTFPEGLLRLHLVLAKTASVLAIPVVVTGVWLWRRPQARRWHRRAVFAFAVGALAATGTGIWMFLQAAPR